MTLLEHKFDCLVFSFSFPDNTGHPYLVYCLVLTTSPHERMPDFSSQVPYIVIYAGT